MGAQRTRWRVAVGQAAIASALLVAALAPLLVRRYFEGLNHGRWVAAAGTEAPRLVVVPPGSKWVGLFEGRDLVLTEFVPDGTIHRHRVDLQLPDDAKELAETPAAIVMPLSDGALAFAVTVTVPKGLEVTDRLCYGRVGIREADGRTWVRVVHPHVSSLTIEDHQARIAVLAQWGPGEGDPRELTSPDTPPLETWLHRFDRSGAPVEQRRVCEGCSLWAAAPAESGELHAWGEYFDEVRAQPSPPTQTLVLIPRHGPARELARLPLSGNVFLNPPVRADDGRFAMTGYVSGDVSVGATKLTGAGADDAIVAVCSADGSLQFARRLGGFHEDRGYAVAFAPDGSVVALTMTYVRGEAGTWDRLIRGQAAGPHHIDLTRFGRDGSQLATRRLFIGPNSRSNPIDLEFTRPRLGPVFADLVTIIAPRRTLAPLASPDAIIADTHSIFVGVGWH